jgi:hypothetical protein
VVPIPYRTLRVVSEEIALKNGKRVIVVWAFADKPPIVGGTAHAGLTWTIQYRWPTLRRIGASAVKPQGRLHVATRHVAV